MKIICLDIETTGFDPNENAVLEIAAIKFDLEKNYETFHNFVEFKGEIPSLIQKLTSITSQDVYDAPSLSSLKQELLEFCGDLPIMGHNISFDKNFLAGKDIHIPGALLDTMPLSHMAFEKISSFSLEILSKTFNTENQPSHRAIDDVRANIELFRTICDRLNQLPQQNKDLLLQALQNNQNPDCKIYLHLLEHCLDNDSNSQDSDTSEQNTQQNNSLRIQAVDFNLLKKIKQDSQQEIKNPNNYIDKSLVINSISDPNADIFSLMRILAKLGDNTHIDDINFRSDQFGLIHRFCHKQMLDLQTGNYICSIETLLNYHQAKAIPSHAEIQILDGPYLEESFIHHFETTLRSSDFETAQNTEQLTFLYMHLVKYIREELSLHPDQNFFGSLDKFTLTKAPFLDFLHQLSKLPNQSAETQAKLQKFSEQCKSGHVFCMMQNNNFPAFKSIPANLQIDKRSLLEYLTGLQVTLTQSNSSDRFLLETQDLGIHQKDPLYLETLTEQLFQALKDTEQKALVICPSSDNIRYVYDKLCLKFQELGIELLAQNQSGSKGKILANLSDDTSTPQILMCSHHFFLKFHPDLHGCQKAILTKLPIGSPSHFYYKIKEKQAENSFIEITIPNTGNNINHICSALSQQNINHLFVLDDRMHSTGWGKNIKRYLDKSIEHI